MANTVLYLDCASGISGDMLLGALVDAGADLTTIQAGIDSLGLPDCRLELAEVKRHAFRAAKVTVHHAEEHAHRHLHHITEMIDRSRLTERQQDLAKQIFQRLGEAEAKVHGSTLRKVHFHEVGAADSIADIAGAAIGATSPLQAIHARNRFDADDLGLLMGMQGAAAGLAGALGPIFGAVIHDSAGSWNPTVLMGIAGLVVGGILIGSGDANEVARD